VTRILFVAFTLFLAFALSSSSAPAGGKNFVNIRGQMQQVWYYPPLASCSGNCPIVIFAPGDGGWRGFAVTIAETMASWGYEVYGLDTKRYLESFTADRATLTESHLASDLAAVAAWARRGRNVRVILLGWSEGAGLVLPVSGSVESRAWLAGLGLIGTPRKAVLGWRFSDTLATLARRDVDEPQFETRPWLSRLGTVPVYMIHSTQDEYTTIEQASALYDAASGPKRFARIEGGNHRFDNRRPQFFAALREGLQWLRTQTA
jgi:fermentation-respiration switch protein FrsA (DUF1100 family)